MKLIIALLAFLISYPVPAMATDLQIFKPKAKTMAIVQTGPSVALSQFNITKGDGRTNWFITLTNNSRANMPRNIFEVRASQLDRQANETPAGIPFKLNKDIRPGGTLNLQQQFTPGSHITRIVIQVVDTRKNIVVGTGTFATSTGSSPSQIQSSPATAANAAAASANSSHAANTSPSNFDIDRINLELTISETDNRKVTLNITNKGLNSVNLNRYDITLEGHQMLRPDMIYTFHYNEILQPGASTSRTTNPIDNANCANFTHYTATARDNGSTLVFEGRLDLAPPLAEIKGISLSVGYSDKNFGLNGNVGDHISVTMNVTNNSTRYLHQADILGTMVISGGKVAYHFDFPGNIGVAPGQTKRVVVDLPIHPESSLGTGVYMKFGDLMSLKPTYAKVALRLGSGADCGMLVFFSNMIEVEWKK
jgi:hypothetical protein